MKKKSSYNQTVSVSNDEKAYIEDMVARGEDESLELSLPIGDTTLSISNLHNFHRVTLTTTDENGDALHYTSQYWVAHFILPAGIYTDKQGLKTRVYSKDEIDNLAR